MGVIFKRPILNIDYAPVILWDNILEGYDTLTGNASVGDALDYATNTYWSIVNYPNTLEVTLPASTGASYFGLCSHNLHTVDATLELQVSDDGVAWTSLFSITPEDGTAIFVPFQYTESIYWRVRVTGGTDDAYLGVIFVGNGIKFETGILPSYTPMYMAEDITLLTSQTISGQFMPNRIERRGLSTSFALNVLDRSFIEGAEFQAFRRYYNDGGSFFFSSNPRELRDDVAYCWRQGNGTIQPTFAENGLFYSTQLALEGFLD